MMAQWTSEARVPLTGVVRGQAVFRQAALNGDATRCPPLTPPCCNPADKAHISVAEDHSFSGKRYFNAPTSALPITQLPIRTDNT
jgi:hypothetical protein